jgi:hypothetical protein
MALKDRPGQDAKDAPIRLDVVPLGHMQPAIAPANVFDDMRALESLPMRTHVGNSWNVSWQGRYADHGFVLELSLYAHDNWRAIRMDFTPNKDVMPNEGEQLKTLIIDYDLAQRKFRISAAKHEVHGRMLSSWVSREGVDELYASGENARFEDAAERIFRIMLPKMRLASHDTHTEKAARQLHTDTGTTVEKLFEEIKSELTARFPPEEGHHAQATKHRTKTL